MDVSALVTPTFVRPLTDIVIPDRPANPDPMLGEIISAETRCQRAAWTAPTFEIVKGTPGIHAPWIDTLPDRCKHGLMKGSCATCNGCNNPDYLAEDRPKAKRYTTHRKFKKDKAWQGEYISLHPDLACPKQEPRTMSAAELHDLRAREQKEWERRRRLGLPTGKLREPRDVELIRHAYERKLFAEVAVWCEKDKSVWEKARQFQRMQRATHALERSAEQQLTCATRRYVTVCRMFRKRVISNSAVQETKEHLMRLFKLEQPDVALPIVRHYVRHGADELSFVRQQDLNLAMKL